MSDSGGAGSVRSSWPCRRGASLSLDRPGFAGSSEVMEGAVERSPNHHRAPSRSRHMWRSARRSVPDRRTHRRHRPPARAIFAAEPGAALAFGGTAGWRPWVRGCGCGRGQPGGHVGGVAHGRRGPSWGECGVSLRFCGSSRIVTTGWRAPMCAQGVCAHGSAPTSRDGHSRAAGSRGKLAPAPASSSPPMCSPLLRPSRRAPSAPTSPNDFRNRAQMCDSGGAGRAGGEPQRQRRVRSVNVPYLPSF